MSDQRPTPDPMDKAYAEAEAMLGDEAQRAARRARVLAAVAREAPAGATQTKRRSARQPLGWLAAASVAGLAVLIATRLDLAPPQPSTPVPAPVPSPGPVTAPPPAAPAAAAQPPPAAPTPERRSEPVQSVAAPPPDAAFRTDVAPAPAPPPPLPVPPVEHRIEEPRPPPAPPPAAAPPAVVKAQPRASNTIEEMVVTEPHRTPPERLRAAAEGGRTGDIEALLVSGVDVDAADAAGETALMKAVQAEQPAAAALLRRHGASLKRKNHAGVSAQDMAAAIANPDVNRALGIKP